MLVNIDFTSDKMIERYKEVMYGESSEIRIDEDGWLHFGVNSQKTNNEFVRFHSVLNVSQGVYEYYSCGSFFDRMFESDFSVINTAQKMFSDFHAQCEWIKNKSEYFGSADSWQQVLDVVTEFAESDDAYILTFSRLTPQDNAGWRWHKNGEYIGNQQPCYEYLGDCDHIAEIVAYHFWKIDPKFLNIDLNI